MKNFGVIRYCITMAQKVSKYYKLLVVDKLSILAVKTLQSKQSQSGGLLKYRRQKPHHQSYNRNSRFHSRTRIWVLPRRIDPPKADNTLFHETLVCSRDEFNDKKVTMLQLPQCPIRQHGSTLSSRTSLFTTYIGTLWLSLLLKYIDVSEHSKQLSNNLPFFATKYFDNRLFPSGGTTTTLELGTLSPCSLSRQSSQAFTLLITFCSLHYIA